jgi:argininosuccinate lyase
VAESAGPPRRGGADRENDASVEPNEKLWGGRFKGATDLAAEMYMSSIENDEMFLDEDIIASIAHARMLGRQRIIPPPDAERIVRTLEALLDDPGFELDAHFEDVHMNVEAYLIEKIGAAGARLHTARSRNDQVATDFKLYVKASHASALRGLTALQSAIVDLAERNIDVVMPGYTHLQRAQPVLLAHHLLAYVEMFERDFRRFAAAISIMDELPLGSGALAGVPYPIDRDAVREELGFDRLTANSIDAVSDRDFVADYLYVAALTMVHISRLAEDVILWSSSEFGFVTLPDAFSTGSSIMPQKKNPDVLELARGRSARAIGNVVEILTLLKGLPLSYNRDLQEDKEPVFDTEHVLQSTLHVLAAMLPKLTVNAERARAAAAANYSLATDLADYLVRKGLPFREAHEAVGKLVRYAEEKASALNELSIEEYRTFSPLFDDDVLKIDLASSIASRDVPGGTAPGRVREALAAARARIDEAKAIMARESTDGEDGGS